MSALLSYEMLFISYFARQRRRPIGLSDAGGKVLPVQQFRGVRIFIFATLFSFYTITFTPFRSFCVESAAEQLRNTAAAPLLPNPIANKWKLNKTIRLVKGADCASLPSGEIGLEYGLSSISISSYAHDKDTFIVEGYTLGFPSNAYGFFTFLQSQSVPGSHQLWAERHVIQIYRERGTAPVNAEFLEALKKTIAGENPTLPPLIRHLPQTGKRKGSELYTVGPKALAKHLRFGAMKGAISFEGGTEAVIAEYQHAEATLGLLLLEFHTPQLATDGHARIDSFRAKLTEPELSQTVVKRVGNYVAVINPVKDITIADSILGEIKYTAVVHWEGKKYSAIPLEYRPPDTAALEEASETAAILLRTFYWIGLMIALAAIFGVVAGSSFFYWRRYQRRKAGIDDLFADPSGTIRLNLDDETEKAERKLLN